MIPNFNPNKWDREKIIDYVIGDEPLDDQQLAFLVYFDRLQNENKELKNYCCKRNDCGGRLKQNHKLTDSEVLTEFEKWLEEKMKCTEQYADNDMAKGYINAIRLCKYYLQELKEGKK